MNRAMIRIGNQTNYDAPARLPYEFALRRRFDAFEWLSDKGRLGWCEDDMTSAERAELRREGEANGIRFSVHAPFIADPTTGPGAQAILRSIQFGGEVAANVVNLHLLPEHPARRFSEALGPFLEAARAAGLRLTLENTPHTSPEHCNAAFEALSALPEAAGVVGMCLDSGHANLFAGTRGDAARFVALLGDHVPILHWHAHENWGDWDSHLPLFTGPSARDERGLAELIRLLKGRSFSGSVILEQWPQPPEILIETRTRLRQMLEAP